MEVFLILLLLLACLLGGLWIMNKAASGLPTDMIYLEDTFMLYEITRHRQYLEDLARDRGVPNPEFHSYSDLSKKILENS